MALAALLLAACASSSKPGTAGSTTATSADPSADAAAAKALVLQPGDLPSDWKASPHERDDTEKAAEKQLAACVGGSDPTQVSAHADGPDFDKGDATVTSSANVVRTRSDFEADLAALRSPKVQPCLETVFKTLVQSEMQKETPGATITKIAMTKLPIPAVGEVTAGYRVTIDVNVEGQALTVFDDSIQYLKGRSEVTIDFTNVGAPFDTAIESAVLAKAKARIGAAR